MVRWRGCIWGRRCICWTSCGPTGSAGFWPARGGAGCMRPRHRCGCWSRRGGGLPALRHVLIGGSKLDARVAGGAGAAGAGGAGARVLRGGGGEFHHFGRGRIVRRARSGGPIRGWRSGWSRGRIWVRSPYLFEGYAGEDPGGAVWRDGLAVGRRDGARCGTGICIYGAGRADGDGGRSERVSRRDRGCSGGFAGGAAGGRGAAAPMR